MVHIKQEETTIVAFVASNSHTLTTGGCCNCGIIRVDEDLTVLVLCQTLAACRTCINIINESVSGVATGEESEIIEEGASRVVILQGIGIYRSESSC